jgi:hypothetical protein
MLYTIGGDIMGILPPPPPSLRVIREDVKPPRRTMRGGTPSPKPRRTMYPELQKRKEELETEIQQLQEKIKELRQEQAYVQSGEHNILRRI